MAQSARARSTSGERRQAAAIVPHVAAGSQLTPRVSLARSDNWALPTGRFWSQVWRTEAANCLIMSQRSPGFCPLLCPLCQYTSGAPGRPRRSPGAPQGSSSSPTPSPTPAGPPRSLLPSMAPPAAQRHPEGVYCGPRQPAQRSGAAGARGEHPHPGRRLRQQRGRRQQPCAAQQQQPGASRAQGKAWHPSGDV
jgi:hypothetical protein